MNSLLTTDHKYLANCMKLYSGPREILWDLNVFPDGQLQVKIKKEYLGTLTEDLKVVASLYSPAALDLFYQVCSEFGVRSVKVNYLYGARSDKHISGNYSVCNVASLSVFNLISLCVDQSIDLEVLAPHCHKLFQKSKHIKLNFDLPDCVNLYDYDLIVYPDQSACERFTHINKPFIVCDKERDQETGSIIKHLIPEIPDTVTRVLVLDDLCDYGTTYCNIIEALPDNVVKDLFIFHGVFTDYAPVRLLEHYNKIYVSNSLPHIQDICEYVNLPDRLIVFDVWNNSM